MLKTVQVKISDLIKDKNNARKHGVKNIESIKGSLSKFGQQKPIVVDKNGVVVAGNGTLDAAIELGWETIDVVYTSLEGSDVIAYAIADNRTSDLAEWDMGALEKALASIESDGFDISSIGFEPGDVEELNKLSSENEESEKGGDIAGDAQDDDFYTKKIKIPIYEPKGEKPSISELIERKKTDEMIAEIRAAGLGDDVEGFLIAAAERHTSFNFRKIAEFYCHADKSVQELMEKSALVIVDFKKAVECGFVEHSKKLCALVSSPSEEEDSENDS